MKHYQALADITRCSFVGTTNVGTPIFEVTFTVQTPTRKCLYRARTARNAQVCYLLTSGRQYVNIPIVYHFTSLGNVILDEADVSKCLRTL